MLAGLCEEILGSFQQGDEFEAARAVVGDAREHGTTPADSYRNGTSAR
ncbi:MAG TPA: hypothetical protein VIJ82_16810 [Streptosporangiaceae bacterium]